MIDKLMAASAKPAREQGQAPNAGAAANGSQDALTHVLVVDDDHSIRETVRMLLEDAGYQVSEAVHGGEALPLLRGGPSYVVLLDLMMPQLDGASLLSLVAEDPELERRHSFVLMTADQHATRTRFKTLLARLAVPVIRKPFDIEVLLQHVERAAQRLRASHGGVNGSGGHWGGSGNTMPQ